MAVPNPIYIPMTISADMAAIPISVAADTVSFDLGVGAAIYVSQTENYEGPYEVTPNRETQTLYTIGKKALNNITVNPIPPEYGLITWDGSVLTVS